MNERSEGVFSDGMSGKQQGMSLKDYYLTKSQVVRRCRRHKLMEENEENLLRGLLCDMDEMRQLDEVGRRVFSRVYRFSFDG